MRIEWLACTRISGTWRRRRRVQTAFTLIELLVVIAIIGLLMALLFPSLQQARAQAKSVACRSNLRSMVVGVMLWAQGRRDELPISVGFGDGYSANFCHFMSRVDGNGLAHRNVGIWPIYYGGAMTKELFYCPADRMRSVATHFPDLGSGGSSSYSIRGITARTGDPNYLRSYNYGGPRRLSDPVGAMYTDGFMFRPEGSAHGDAYNTAYSDGSVQRVADSDGTIRFFGTTATGGSSARRNVWGILDQR